MTCKNDKWPEWMNIRTLGKYTNLSHRTLESWKQLGFLPPHNAVTKRRHLWRKTDIDTWLELKRIGQLDDYQDLRDRLGVHDAWAVLVARLDDAKARTAAVIAKEVAQ